MARLLEVRGLGIVRLPFIGSTHLALVVELGEPAAENYVRSVRRGNMRPVHKPRGQCAYCHSKTITKLGNGPLRGVIPRCPSRISSCHLLWHIRRLSRKPVTGAGLCRYRQSR